MTGEWRRHFLTEGEKKVNRREKEPIDFVITWVDGNDQKWQEEKDKMLIAQGLGVHIDGRKERYRDWDNL